MLECCGLQPCSGDRVPCLVQIKSKKDSKKTQDSDCSIQIKFLFIQLLPKLSLSPTKQKTKTKQTKNNATNNNKNPQTFYLEASVPGKI